MPLRPRGSTRTPVMWLRWKCCWSNFWPANCLWRSSLRWDPPSHRPRRWRRKVSENSVLIPGQSRFFWKSHNLKVLSDILLFCLFGVIIFGLIRWAKKDSVQYTGGRYIAFVAGGVSWSKFQVYCIRLRVNTCVCHTYMIHVFTI